MENDTRETLVNICESLQAQFRYLASLNRSLVALYEAIKRDHPEIEEAYREEVRPLKEHLDHASNLSKSARFFNDFGNSEPPRLDH